MNSGETAIRMHSTMIGATEPVTAGRGCSEILARIFQKGASIMAALLTLPAVDGVEITTIMDNSFDGLLSSTSVARRFPIAHYGFLEHRSRNEREGLIDQEEYDVHKKQGTITGCSSE